MDPAALLFAAASLPILTYHGVWYHRERALENRYGIFAGLFAFSGALLVTAGFPGSLILPGTFGIMVIGSLHAYMRERSRGRILRFTAFAAVSALLILLEVFI